MGWQPDAALIAGLGAALVLLVALLLVNLSWWRIGPTEVGLVRKRFSRRRLGNDDPVAFDGEAGYQADLLMPGWRFKNVLLHSVEKHPWVQVPAGQVGVVVAQVGGPLPIGAKSARYDPAFGGFADLRRFHAEGGQKGVQRPVLPPGTLAPVHPIAFLVITKEHVYGVPVAEELRAKAAEAGGLRPEHFGLAPEQLELLLIEPSRQSEGGRTVTTDVIGVVTTFEGRPPPSGAIANRLGDFADVEAAEREAGVADADLVEMLLASKNHLHDNYQDYQAFLDAGGRIGLQHDPLLYGQYALNPFLVRVERVPMLVVRQGEVAVVKAYVGLASRDTSGQDFKFGSLVRPGHRGVWQEPLRTGKYPINPRVYQAEIVPTAILTLNWADAQSQAHNLDKGLRQIVAKSREGFVFAIDLQVQIHIADTKAPRVISMVGSMLNLANEVLQAAVGNHFRDTLQSMRAIEFIERRQQVQHEAEEHVRRHLDLYHVETRGVYIQDVVLPEQLVEVLTRREIAHQEVATFEAQRQAQEARVATEASRGRAEMQAELARSEVGVAIKRNDAEARTAEAEGEAAYIGKTGAAEGAKVEAVGLAHAKGYEAQVRALGALPTALINVARELADGDQRFVPEILVTGGDAAGGLGGLLMKYLQGLTSQAHPPEAGPPTARLVEPQGAKAA